MKKNTTVTSGIIIFAFILSGSTVTHAALAESAHAIVWEQKNFLIEGTARLFSHWLNHKKPNAPILKMTALPEKSKTPISGWEQQLSASRLVAASA